MSLSLSTINPIKCTNLMQGYTTTDTSAGTTTLTAASTHMQYFTGTTTHTVILPAAGTLTEGYSYTIVNRSTGVVTVRSSVPTTIVTIASGNEYTFTCIDTTAATGIDGWFLSSLVAGLVMDNSASPKYPLDHTKGVWYGLNTRANAFDGTSITLGQNAATKGLNAIAMGNSSSAAASSVSIGHQAGTLITSGINNTLIGYQAGSTLTSGSNNILLGFNTLPSSATVSNEITIGNSSNTLFRSFNSYQHGTNVTATAGNSAHAEGIGTTASGLGAHSQGNADTAGNILASGSGSHAYGRAISTGIITSSGIGSAAGGYVQNTATITATNTGAYAYGMAINVGTITATGQGAYALGYSEAISSTGMIASGTGSRAFGYTSSYGTITASGIGATAEGYSLLTQGASGNGLIATGNGSHVEGYTVGTNGTIQATGIGAHAEGYASTGSINLASGIGSHVEGQNTKASGIASHAEGYADPGGILIASGLGAHAQGSSKLSGQIFITGQDPDFHCQGDSPPTVVFLQTGLNYSMGGTLGQHINKIVWVESYQVPLPSGHLYGYNCFPFLSASLGTTLVLGSAPITNITGNGTTVTYTCANNFTAGQIVSIRGAFPTAYNLTNVTIATRTATQFTVTNPATGVYQQGGYVRNPAAGDYDIVDNLGFSEITLEDYRTIAVASTFGGMLRTAELNSLGARLSDITTFVAQGGGIFASAEYDAPATTGPHTSVITNAVGNGVTVTYTSANTFVPGEIVTITGINPVAYNLSNVTIVSRTPTQFTITNAATGAYVSGGTASAPHIQYFSWFPGGGSVTITTPSPPYTPTAFGVSLGLNAVNLNAVSHNSFLSFPMSLAIVSVDSLGRAMALATTGISTIQATNDGSSAQGSIFGVGYITASGLGSHAEGRCVSSGSIVASGAGAHAEGYAAFAQQNTASGLGSHVEGQNTTASGDDSHAEGLGTTANGIASHAEGQNTTSSGNDSHAEGQNTTASGNDSHAEGLGTTASGIASHAEGQNATASGFGSHAEGLGTTASGIASHAEGFGCNTFTNYSHTEGYQCQTFTVGVSDGMHAEGYQTVAYFRGCHSEGISTTAGGYCSHTEGQNNIIATTANYSHAEGVDNVINTGGLQSHVEGRFCQTNGICAHAEGFGCFANGDYSHAEGNNCLASGNYSHAAGQNAQATATNTYCWSDITGHTNSTPSRYAIKATGQVEILNGAATSLLTATHNSSTTWTYNAQTPANWSGSAPTTIAQAIDRLAAAYQSQHGAVP